MTWHGRNGMVLTTTQVLTTAPGPIDARKEREIELAQIARLVEVNNMLVC